MSQDDLTLVNASGSTVRAKINTALGALGSLSAGSGRPATPTTPMIWVKNTVTPWEMYFYDGTSDILMGTFNASTHIYTPAGVSGAISKISNLIIKTNAGTPYTQIDVSADVIPVTDGTNWKTFTGISGTVDFSVNGAINRLDTGTMSSGTWYYIWYICKSDGTGAGLLGSLSSSAPTMPTGYTVGAYKKLIGAARSDGSTHFLKFYQNNDRVWYQVKYTVKDGTDGSWTSISLAVYVPPIATSAFLYLSSYGNGGNQAYLSWDGISACVQAGTQYGGSNSVWIGHDAEVPLPTAQTVWYLAGYEGLVDVRGFKLNF